MSEDSQNCPKCKSPYGYKDANLWVCPECFHEWSTDILEEEENPQSLFLDANGVELKDGDQVATVKDLKLGKSTLKSGTKVKNIKLLSEPVNGHDISCKISGHGQLYLKCSVVKKL